MTSETPLADGTDGSVSVWHELAAACDEAIQASRQVGVCLDDGVAVAELVPLLKRELGLARSIQSQIGRLRVGDLPSRSTPDAVVARDRLAGSLAELLGLEQQNQRLLSLRGVRINGPPPRVGRRKPPMSGTHGSDLTSA